MPGTNDKPVFIDQMPDYKEAMQKIASLSENKTAFTAAVEKLGLSKEWERTQADIDNLHKQIPDTRSEKVFSVARVAAAAAGIIVGVIGAKRWGIFKGAVAGVAAAVATGITATVVTKNKIPRSDDVVSQQEQSVAAQSAKMQQSFAEAMATRMLEQRKELAGEGSSMKLVSNAEDAPSRSGGMVAKLAEQKAVQAQRAGNTR